MKIRSLLKKITPGIQWAGLAVLLASSHFAMAEEEVNACEKTARLVLLAEQASALSDYWLALAKAMNIGDPTARKAARAQALADWHEARADHRDQRDARLEACEKLGPGRYDPAIDPANFVATIDNPYFPLTPGKTFVYEGQTAEGLEHAEFAVTHNTRVIHGVTCVEVRDLVMVDGVVAEDTLDWFAQDVDGNVWYFGENTREFEDGLITSLHGTFAAGVAGDKPGIIMKAQPAVGDFYRQEFSLANAEDWAETISLTETVTVLVGMYTNCLQSQETTPLEPDLLEHKFYAPGVGNVLTIDLNTGNRFELVEIRTE